MGDGSVVLGVDVGNTRIKIFALTGASVREDPAGLLVATAPSIEAWDASCAGPVADAVSAAALPEDVRVHVVSVVPGIEVSLGAIFAGAELVVWGHDRPLPIDHPYENPETLGIDRLVAALAAARLWPSEPLVVVDAGTAITVDLVAPEGTFLGGAIAPGRELIARGLGEGGKQLHRVDARDPGAYPGTSTEACLRQGVDATWSGALRELVRRALHASPGARVVVTGGDGADACRVLADHDPALAPGLIATGLLVLEEHHVR